MNKITLTARGREILSQNTLQGGEAYWVGYFGLAYVPDQGRFSDEQTRLINDDEHGDYIYNLWQGDLVNEGHSIASDNLRKLTMYDRNLTSNFRYMYDDEKDCNRLVTWTTKDDSESGSSSYVREGYHIYNGITQGESNNTGDTDTESELPCPAPLFYAGGSASYGTAPENPADFMNTVSADWPKCKVNGDDCPMVTPDMRAYPGTWAGATSTGWNWVPQNAGKYDTLPSYITRKTAAGEDGAESLDQYAKFLSVSNFNKEHGHVSAEGYNVGYQESCHNMSMVTRLFPIASYELTATSEPSTNDPNRSERGSAKSIKYVIRMDLKSAYQGVRAYLDTLTYQKSDTEGVEPEDIALYTSKKPNSFKFNRIGIYAVPVTIRHFYKEGDAANRKDCRATHYQMEISPDAKPELFAVMQVDEVCMSEDGSFGLSDYNTTFVLNLENVSDNTSLCTNPEVYYNLAENEAITWYQNQLIATAGLSEAVTNLGVNMAHMMNNRPNASCGECSFSDSTSTVDVPSYGVFTETYDGLVPKSSEAGDTDKFLKGDGTWAVPVVSPSMPIIIRDVDLPLYDEGKRYAPNYSRARLTILKSDGFHVINQDGQESLFDNVTWDYSKRGPSYEHFSFGGANQLVWYTWGALYDEDKTPNVINNNNRTLYLDTTTLLPGVVYEIAIKICAIGSDMINMITTGNNGFGIYFYNDLDGSGNECLENWYKWADVSAESPVYYALYPNFELYVEPTDGSTHRPLYDGNNSPGSGRTEPVLASATIHFVKVDGKVYVMSY